MPHNSKKSTPSHPASISPRTTSDEIFEPFIEYVEEEVYVPTERFLKSTSNFPPVRTRRRYHDQHPAFSSSKGSTRGTPSSSSSASSSRGVGPGAFSMPSLVSGKEARGLRRTYGMCEAEFEELNRKFVGLGRAGRALSADPDLWKGRGGEEWNGEEGAAGEKGGKRTGSGRRERSGTESRGADGGKKESKKKDKVKKRDSR
eukprot:GFKZ01000119.1.p1 GENE.GFKZ01000119.1~~GFKZ01000119.1.p1  ORF type:complete len:202 (-),score=34.09 GFKZ01000119.1:427-1032(-)